MMRTATIDAGEEQSRYVGRVYQEYYAGLLYYFLSQLGDAPGEADAYVRETIDNFLSTEDGRLGADAKHAPARLLEIAGRVYSEKSAAESARVENRPGLEKTGGLLHKIRDGVLQPIKVELGQLFQGRRAATPVRG